MTETSPKVDGARSPDITFLFTDIEGSTALWEQYPDAMQAALVRHDGTLRRAIESSGGRVIKNTGDGLYAVFGVAGDALQACLAAQRELLASAAANSNPASATSGNSAPIALRVRMGLHTGAAEFRDGDYFGAALNRAARIMSAAHGGQVLLSASTAALVAAQLSEGVSLRDMGEHRLKGLQNAERLLQLVATGLPADFPPLESLTAHSLQAERDLFIGRDAALNDLARRMRAGSRLVSVLGLGGTGKTRLVTRFGWRSLGEFAGGVWFCDLSQARSADGIVHAVAQALDVPLGKDDPVVQLGHAISARGKCLMILDNFEQVARYAEETLGRWLNRARDARFLVTTRDVLGVPGEEILALAPLGPVDAAQLFMCRAEAAQPGFLAGDDDRAAIAPLVAMLEGLPLAIELAAARVRVIPPRVLLLRMRERFKVLASTHGRVDRQATLRAVFDWSWELLTLPEKAALAQLSVFEGGFTLASVEAVLDLSAYADAPWTLDALQSLVQKSLIRQVRDDRFDLLVSVQEYAAEHLRTVARYPGSGPAALLAAEVRHGAHFAGFDETAAIAQSCIELDNLVVACRRAAARGDASVAVGALEAAWAALSLRGPASVGTELASLVRATAGIPAAAIARVDWIAARALETSGRIAEAYVQFESAVARGLEAGDRRSQCKALTNLAFLDVNDGRLEASRVHGEQALAVARALGDPTLRGRVHNTLAVLEEAFGNVAGAKAHYEAGLALARECGDGLLSGHLLGNLAGLYTDEGSTEQAAAHYEAALDSAREVGDRRLECITRCNLGWLKRMEEDFGEARAPLEESLRMARDMGFAHVECVVLFNLGIACERMRLLDEAGERFEASLLIARELGDRRFQGLALAHLGVLHAHGSRFAEAERCLDSGLRLLEEANHRIELAIALCCRVEAAHLAGMRDVANQALAAATSIADGSGLSEHSEMYRAVTRAKALLIR